MCLHSHTAGFGLRVRAHAQAPMRTYSGLSVSDFPQKCRESFLQSPLSPKCNVLFSQIDSFSSFFSLCFLKHSFMLSCFSHVRLFATLWTTALQAPQSMGFSRQEYWSGSPFPSPGHLPDPGTKPMSLTSSALAGRFFTTSTTWEN